MRGEVPKRLEVPELSPLPQILLANAIGNVDMPITSNLHTIGRASSGANSILSTAIGRYRGEEQLPIPWLTHAPESSWAIVNALYLAQLTARFDDSVSVLLHFANATGTLSSLQRQQLNGLLFHPLQNADQHGRHADPKRTFAGVSARIVSGPEPETPSITEYLAALDATWPARPHSRREMLELIVHDNGLGIAAHFYNATRKPGDPDFNDLSLFGEWQRLNNAFERHQTSKRVTFRRATGTLAMPGVGLAGLLNATKQLRAFLELRTGRLRAFQWYRADDVIADRNLLRPDGLPAAAPRLVGTIFRFFVPLYGPSDAVRSVE